MARQYVLKQRVRAGKQEHEGTVTFQVENQDELAELLVIYGAGKVDERIDDQLPPNYVYEQPYVRVEMVGLFAPNGVDVWPVMKRYAAQGAVQAAMVS